MKNAKNFTMLLLGNSKTNNNYSYIIKEDEVYEIFINFAFDNNDKESVVDVTYS